MVYSYWEKESDIKNYLQKINYKKEVKKSGIPVIYEGDSIYTTKDDSHSLIIGATGSGKTQSTILPLLKLAMLANESVIINDPNGDIARITVIGSTLDITLKGKDQPTETSRKDGAGTLYDQGLIDHCKDLKDDEFKKCNESYPTIEYKEDINTWGIVLDVGLTVLPIVAIVVFFSWMMRQATAANSQSMSFG